MTETQRSSSGARSDETEKGSGIEAPARQPEPNGMDFAAPVYFRSHRDRPDAKSAAPLDWNPLGLVAFLASDSAIDATTRLPDPSPKPLLAALAGVSPQRGAAPLDAFLKVRTDASGWRAVAADRVGPGMELIPPAAAVAEPSTTHSAPLSSGPRGRPLP
jgi:hypothetical protein